MLDTELLEFLPDVRKEELRNYEATFESAGWPQIVAWAEKERVESEQRVLVAKDWDDVIAWRARWFVMDQLARLRDQVYAEYENAAVEARMDAENEAQFAAEFGSSE